MAQNKQNSEAEAKKRYCSNVEWHRINKISVRIINLFRLITGFVTRLTRRVHLVEQKLLTLPEHLSSLPVFSGVHVTRSLALCVCFVDNKTS
jgi:hypothetical protein